MFHRPDNPEFAQAMDNEANAERDAKNQEREIDRFAIRIKEYVVQAHA